MNSAFSFLLVDFKFRFLTRLQNVIDEINLIMTQIVGIANAFGKLFQLFHFENYILN